MEEASRVVSRFGVSLMALVVKGVVFGRDMAFWFHHWMTGTGGGFSVTAMDCGGYADINPVLNWMTCIVKSFVTFTVDSDDGKTAESAPLFLKRFCGIYLLKFPLTLLSSQSTLVSVSLLQHPPVVFPYSRDAP